MNPELPQTQPSKPSWGLLFRAVVTIGILVWLAGRIEWTELGQQFLNADGRWVGTAVGFYLVVIAFVILRWWTLLKVQDVRLPLSAVTKLSMIGLFFNTLLPGAVGGDVVKIYYILKYAPHRKARAALSILMDRFIGMFVLLLIAVGTLPWQIRYFAEHPELQTIMISLATLLAATTASILVFLLFPFDRLPNELRQQWTKIPKHDVFASLMEGFRQHARAPKLTFMAMLFAAGAHLSGFIAGWMLAQGLHLDVSLFQMAVILAVVYILMNLPISISGHGVREFGAVQMMTIYGVLAVHNPEPAVAFSLLLFGIYLIWGIIGGVVYLTAKHEMQS